MPHSSSPLFLSLYCEQFKLYYGDRSEFICAIHDYSRGRKKLRPALTTSYEFSNMAVLPEEYLWIPTVNLLFKSAGHRCLLVNERPLNIEQTALVNVIVTFGDPSHCQFHTAAHLPLFDCLSFLLTGNDPRPLLLFFLSLKTPSLLGISFSRGNFKARGRECGLQIT